MRKIKYITVISNISVEPFFVPIMQKAFSKRSENVVTISISYGEHRKKEYLKYLKESIIVVVWLNLEVLIPDIHNGTPFCMHKEEKRNELQKLCGDVAEYIFLYSRGKMIWFLFEDYFLHLPMIIGHNYNSFIMGMNKSIQENLPDQITFIDLKHLIAEVGIEAAFSETNKFRWNYPYSSSLTQAVADEVLKQYFIENGRSKKCLVLDCDNVLWGGILAEDGMESIRLGESGFGREYQEFQRFVLSLYYRGVVITICSKNDLADVLNVFRKHSGMILKEEHIACFQVNWENKSDNIRRIAEKLNIGIDSIVFVDDSPYEIEEVRRFLPEVTAILYHRKKMYKAFSCFHLKEYPDFTEITKRNNAYRTEVFRQEIKEKYDSYNDYLVALDMKVDIHETLPIECARITELTQRTNKCTNGVRCTVAEIREWIVCKEMHLYTVRVIDKFSDLGIVGAFGVKNCEIILFCLSCRALGRGIEDMMLHFVKKKFQVTKFYFNYTGKNENLKILFQTIFFG